MSQDRHSTLRGPVAHDHHAQAGQAGHENIDSTIQPHAYPEPSSPSLPVMARPGPATRTRTSERLAREREQRSAHLPRPLTLAPNHSAANRLSDINGSSDGAEDMLDGPNTIRINVLAPYIEQGPSRPRGYPVDKGMTVAHLKDALCAGKYGGMPCRRDKMKIICKGRLLEEEEKLGDVVGPKSLPDQVHAFILIAVSPHHIYTPTPLDTDSGPSRSYFTRRNGSGPGITPRPSRPTTPGIPSFGTPQLGAPTTIGTAPHTAESGASFESYLTRATAATGTTFNTTWSDTSSLQTALPTSTANSSTTARQRLSLSSAPNRSDEGYAATLQAVSDSTHFMLFCARHHLFAFLQRPALRWEDMHPKPVFGFEAAREAVRGVLLAVLLSAGAGKGGEVVVALAEAEVRVLLGDLEYGRGNPAGEVDAAALESLWKVSTGRDWLVHSDAKNEVDVEIDFQTMKLHIPPLDTLSPAQRYHLAQYLRITRFLPLLNLILTRIASSPPDPTTFPSTPPTAATTALHPTPTHPHTFTHRTTTPPIPTAQDAGQAAPRPGRQRRVYQFSLHLSLPLLKHAFTSLIQIGGMVWMLTPRMKWTDTRFWIIVFGAMGWWVGDVRRVQVREARARVRAREREEAERRAQDPAYAAMMAEQERVRATGTGQGDTPQQQQGQRQRQEQEAIPDPPLPGQAPVLPPVQPGVQHHGANAGARDHAAGGLFGTAGQNDNMPDAVLKHLAHMHLARESAYLQITPSDPSNNAGPQHPRQQPRPSRLTTYLLLPIYLYFLTLIPALENLRAKAIRERERTIRVMVGELNLPDTGAEFAPNFEQAQAQGEGQGQGEAQTILPRGLDEIGERYYRRVLAKGEGIDWEEEREAQRAAEAEFGRGDGDG